MKKLAIHILLSILLLSQTVLATSSVSHGAPKPLPVIDYVELVSEGAIAGGMSQEKANLCHAESPSDELQKVFSDCGCGDDPSCQIRCSSVINPAVPGNSAVVKVEANRQVASSNKCMGPLDILSEHYRPPKYV